MLAAECPVKTDCSFENFGDHVMPASHLSFIFFVGDHDVGVDVAIARVPEAGHAVFIADARDTAQ